MSGRREWVLMLVAAVLLVVLSGVVAAWTLPMLLWDEASRLAAGLIGGFWMLLGLVAALTLGGGAARGDRLARDAFEREHGGEWMTAANEWEWPSRGGGRLGG